MQQISSRQDFDAYAEYHELPAEVTIGASFIVKGIRYTIIGARPRKTSAPIAAKTETGKLQYFPVRTLKILSRLEKINKIFV